MALFERINGRRVAVSSEAEAKIRAEWAKAREAREAEDAAIAAAAAKLEAATGMTVAEIRLALRG